MLPFTPVSESVRLAAQSYAASDLCVLPADPKKKFTTTPTWKEYRDNPPKNGQIESLFNNAPGICILMGRASRNVEVLDFDNKGELFPAWKSIVSEVCPGMLDFLVIESSQSGGIHVFYRCESSIPGNMKLASRFSEGAKKTLIETRGEGGLVLCAPTPGYALVSGRFENLPVLEAEERETLINIARSLDETTPNIPGGGGGSNSGAAKHTSVVAKALGIHSGSDGGALRPGEDFNTRGDLRGLLESNGWRFSHVSGDNQHWTRPGKSSGTSATFNGSCFYVWTSNSHGFEPSKGYDPFAVFTILNHGGDYSRAASALKSAGFGGKTPPAKNGGGVLGGGRAVAVDYDNDGDNTVREDSPDTPKSYSWGHAVKYDTANDPNTLLGRRWLSKGGSCLWVGPTGMGKSSLTSQAAACWALGKDFFGIKPVRPLRSLIIQAENDIGDIAEMTRGITNGLTLFDNMPELDDRIFFAEDTAVSGLDLIPYARKLINHHKPDLLWIDPLFAFCGCDVSDQGMMSAFLRTGIQKLNQETGVCTHIIHHPNKPRQQNGFPMSSTPGDDAYSGSGTAEIANWARAVLRLKHNSTTDSFELIGAKRGSRCGFTDSFGTESPSNSVTIRHAEKPLICWLRDQIQEKIEDTSERDKAREALYLMDIDKPYPQKDVKNFVIEATGKNRNAVGDSKKPAGRIYQRLLAATTITSQPGFFVRRQHTTID